MQGRHPNPFSIAGFIIVTGCSFLLFGLFFILIEGSPLFLFLKIGGITLMIGVIMAYGLKMSGAEEEYQE